VAVPKVSGVLHLSPVLQRRTAQVQEVGKVAQKVVNREGTAIITLQRRLKKALPRTRLPGELCHLARSQR